MKNKHKTQKYTIEGEYRGKTTRPYLEDKPKEFISVSNLKLAESLRKTISQRGGKNTRIVKLW